MKEMFLFCSSLTNLNLSNFNTQNSTNMRGMFFICSSLTYLNLLNFNTYNGTGTTVMNCYCKILTNLNLSNFNIQNANMYGMFNNCKAFKMKSIKTNDSNILNLMDNNESI